jgi:splicing factor 3A subunit 3
VHELPCLLTCKMLLLFVAGLTVPWINVCAQPPMQYGCESHLNYVQEEYVYNPLKLPLGVDGKPIPYWLYKLHGLNQEYSCEICGGDVFRGRREYERHFRDYKHVNAMHALGIPSSKAFFEVTKVEEALALWENLKDRGAGHWNPETQEEFEDEDGNVYNKKTYMDLKRQGLV